MRLQVCGDVKHRRKLYFCKQFRVLNSEETAVKKLGACERCLKLHDGQAFCKPTYLYKHPDCKDRHRPKHHCYMCPNAVVRSGATLKRSDPPKVRRKGYTVDQEDFIGKLPPELARQCQDVFSNSASKALSKVVKPSRLPYTAQSARASHHNDAL